MVVRIIAAVLLSCVVLFGAPAYEGKWCIEQRIATSRLDSSKIGFWYRSEIHRLSELGAVDSMAVDSLRRMYDSLLVSTGSGGIQRMAYDYSTGVLNYEVYDTHSRLIKKRESLKPDAEGYHCLQISHDQVRVVKKGRSSSSDYILQADSVVKLNVRCDGQMSWAITLDNASRLHIHNGTEMVYMRVEKMPSVSWFSGLFANCNDFQKDLSSSLIFK